MKEESKSSDGSQNNAPIQCRIYDCICFDVTAEEFKKLVEDNDIKTWEELQEIVLIGEACKRCVKPFQKYIESRT